MGQIIKELREYTVYVYTIFFRLSEMMIIVNLQKSLIHYLYNEHANDICTCNDLVFTTDHILGLVVLSGTCPDAKYFDENSFLLKYVDNPSKERLDKLPSNPPFLERVWDWLSVQS